MADKPNIAVKEVRGEHDFDFSDSFSDSRLRIAQTRYYRGDGFALAIAELNKINCWDDRKFDAICSAIKRALSNQGTKP